MIETLEARIAPAGIINITVRGGDVFLTADAADHHFNVSGSPGGGLVITPEDGLLLKLGSAAPTADPINIDTFVRDLRISLRAGADTVTLTDLHTVRNVSVSLGGGAGSNKLVLQNSDVQGSLKVLGSGSNNDLEIGDSEGTTTVGRDLSINLAAGFNQTRISGAGLQIDGDFSYRGSSDQDDLNLTVSTLRILGDVDVRTRTGFGLVEFNTDSTAIFGSTRVVASGRIDSGSTVQFTNSLSSDFGKAVSLIGNAGEDGVTFNGEQFHFAKGISTRLGAGSDYFELSATRITINGTLDFATSAALYASINAQAELLVNGNVLMVGGSIGTSLDIHAPGVITGKIVYAGASSGSLTLAGDPLNGKLLIAGGISWATATNTSDSTINLFGAILGGRSRIVMSSGGTGIVFSGVSVEGPVLIQTEGMDDGIEFGPNGAEPFVAQAAIQIFTGGGDDVVKFGSEMSGATFNALLTLNGGSGQDTLDYLTHGNVFNVAPVIRAFETIL